MHHKHFPFLLVLLLASLVTADDWTSFQNGGRTATGDVTEITLTAETPVIWQVSLDGYGQSSPVQHGDLVYVTFVDGEQKEQLNVSALDFATGDVQWKRTTENSSPEKSTTYVSRAAPSPACDSEGVVAFFEGGNLVAYTAAGDVRWERDLTESYGPIGSRHGLAASLEQTDDAVFVWVERDKEPFLLSLSKTTGKTNWKSPGLGVTSWSSPRLIPLANGEVQLVLSGNGVIAGFDPKTGDQQWEFREISGNSTPTPVPVGDGKFLMGASTGRGATGGGKAAQSNGLIAITQDATGNYVANFVWQAERATSSFGSPLAHQGFAYFVNRSGVVYCLNLETGKEQYAKRTAASVWATPMAVGEQLYFFGKDGTVTVAAAGSTFREISKFQPAFSMDSNHPPKPFSGVLYAATRIDTSFIVRHGSEVFRLN